MKRDQAYTEPTLAGVAGVSVSGGSLFDDSQPYVRVLKVRTSLNPCSPAKGVEANGVRILRFTQLLSQVLSATGPQRKANRAQLQRELRGPRG